MVLFFFFSFPPYHRASRRGRRFRVCARNVHEIQESMGVDGFGLAQLFLHIEDSLKAIDPKNFESPERLY